MTPQELKNSILQQAIQGKLVEQRPEEGTAEELFQQIQKEKQRLIADGKIKKEKPLPEITEDEKPFDIPESWKWVRLGEIANITGGYAFKSTSFCDNGIRVIRISDFNENGFVNSKIVRHVFDDSLTPFIIEEKNILLCMTGGTVGKSYFVKNLTERMMTNQRVATIKILVSIEEYINFVILSPIVQKIIRASKNSTNDNISMETINSFPVPLPPLAEQKRIVAKIEELLPYIDRYEESWLKLEALNSRFPSDMKKSLLQYAIQGKLVEQRPEEGTAEELFERIQKEKQRLIADGKIKKTKSLPIITSEDIPVIFPNSWKVCYIDDIAFVTKLAGFEYTEYIAPNLTTTGIPLFKGKNVQNGRLVFDFDSYIPEHVSNNLQRSQILKKCLLTPYVGTIGNIAIFDGSFKAHLGSNVGKIELLNGDNEYVIEEYVLYYLRSGIGFQQLTKYKKATAQESISIDAIRNVIIAIPPLAEQKRIVAKLEQLLPLCERLK